MLLVRPALEGHEISVYIHDNQLDRRYLIDRIGATRILSGMSLGGTVGELERVVGSKDFEGIVWTKVEVVVERLEEGSFLLGEEEHVLGKHV